MSPEVLLDAALPLVRGRVSEAMVEGDAIVVWDVRDPLGLLMAELWDVEVDPKGTDFIKTALMPRAVLVRTDVTSSPAVRAQMVQSCAPGRCPILVYGTDRVVLTHIEVSSVPIVH